MATIASGGTSQAARNAPASTAIASIATVVLDLGAGSLIGPA